MQQSHRHKQQVYLQTIVYTNAAGHTYSTVHNNLPHTVPHLVHKEESKQQHMDADICCVYAN